MPAFGEASEAPALGLAPKGPRAYAGKNGNGLLRKNINPLNTHRRIVTVYRGQTHTTLWKITKIAATKCHIVRIKCTKFDFRWGSVPDPFGGAYSVPQTSSCI